MLRESRRPSNPATQAARGLTSRVNQSPRSFSLAPKLCLGATVRKLASVSRSRPVVVGEAKFEWLQKRVKDGFSDSVELWGIGQKLHEERVTAERLRVLAASARYQMASYAGEQWKVLLGCREGKGELRLPP